jgi:hypothetical protein
MDLDQAVPGVVRVQAGTRRSYKDPHPSPRRPVVMSAAGCRVIEAESSHLDTQRG